VDLTVDEREEIETETAFLQPPRKQPRPGSTAGLFTSFSNRDTTSAGIDSVDIGRYDSGERSKQPHGVTVVMGDAQTKDLTTLSVAALDAFRNQCRQARKNNHLFSRAKHIPPDSRVRAGINFILRTNNLISEMDKDVWDAWEDDAFFSVLRPIIARRESLNAIPEPQVQFVKEVEAMRLDVTGNFTEVGLEEEFYKAARNHKLVAAVETRDTFTKAKRKEFQKTLHDGFVERGKGVAWKLQGIAQLMSQSNTGDLTMREWFDQLSKQVEYVDSNKFLVELALKQGQSKDSTGNKTGDRNDRGKDRWKKDRISTTAAPGTNKDPSHDAGNNPNNQDTKSTNPRGTKDRPFKRCTGCGRTNHLVGDCAFAKTSKRHPNFNTTTKEWADSEFGEKWEHVTTTPPGPQKLLPFHWQLDPNDPTKAIPYEDPDIADLASRGKSSMKRGAGEDTCHVCTIDIPKYQNRPGIRKLIPMSIVCRGQEEIDTQALLDTGADGPNFVHSTLASQLVSSGIPTQPTNFRACSCFGECRTLTLRVVGDCKLNLPGNPYSYFLPNTSFTICDDLPYDVIIGIDTINEHRLLQYRTDIQTPDSITGHSD